MIILSAVTNIKPYMTFATIINYYKQNTLRTILLVALTFRFLAAVFSTGYGFHDDHFLTIEISQSWVNGTNYNEWIPDKLHPIVPPQGPSLTYPAIIYLTLEGCENIGITDPESKMMFGRFLHALFSLLIVFWGYKIIEKLYDKKAAEYAAWLLAVMWFIPMLSVRNLVEMVCIPFLFWGIWLLISNDKNNLFKYFLAGFITAIAFSIRFQTSTFIAGLGIAVLIKNKFLHTVFFGAGIVFSILLFQALGDFIVWGYPFAELQAYVKVNIANVGFYPDGPWYNFTLLVAGLMIPPLSLMIMFGFLKDWKKALIIVLPVMCFFVFHSSFPNKQERFILPAIPFIISVGTASWYMFYKESKFWQNNRMLHKSLVWFFIVVNTILLFAMTVSSSKKSRVDAMRYLSKDRNIKNLVIENSSRESEIVMPVYYLKDQLPHQYFLLQGNTVEQFYKEASKSGMPQYVLFIDGDDLNTRIDNFKKYFPNIKYETTIEPSLLDKIMHQMNPVNLNFATVIYKIN